MYDTVAAVVPATKRLSSEAFQGGVTTEIFTEEEEKDRSTVRLFHNPSGGRYAPRFTYWPPAADADLTETGWLKAEFSIPKMARHAPGQDGLSLLGNPTEEDASNALDAVDELVTHHFGEQFPIRAWKCQRIDYAWNWTVGPLLPVYLAVLQTLRLSTWSRHPYDASEGVVWKSKSSKGRWVKFYNKGKQLSKNADEGSELLDGDPGVLRYEVSNYKDSVRYMAEHWFGLSQPTVGELVHPFRSLFVMGKFFDRLGLSAGNIGDEEYLLYRLAEEFGPVRASTAWYVLTLHSRYGNASHNELELVKRSTYYSYTRELKAKGFLQQRSEVFALHDDNNDDDDYIASKQQLPRLQLPSKNLSTLSPAPQGEKGSDGVKNYGILPGVEWPASVQ